MHRDRLLVRYNCILFPYARLWTLSMYLCTLYCGRGLPYFLHTICTIVTGTSIAPRCQMSFFHACIPCVRLKRRVLVGGWSWQHVVIRNFIYIRWKLIPREVGLWNPIWVWLMRLSTLTWMGITPPCWGFPQLSVRIAIVHWLKMRKSLFKQLEL